MTANLHMPATAVGEALKDGALYGKVHRIASGRPAAPRGRNRRQYRVACGGIVRAGFPFRVVRQESLCTQCWTLSGEAR